MAGLTHAYAVHAISSCLPQGAELVTMEHPLRHPAILVADLDNDRFPEMVGVYRNSDGLHAIIIKLQNGSWRVVEHLKGSGSGVAALRVAPLVAPNANTLIMGWQMTDRRTVLELRHYYQGAFRPLDPNVYMGGEARPNLTAVTPLQPEKVRDKQLETSLSQAYKLFPEDQASYSYNRIDLNDDGVLETIVYLTGPSFCGTGGCSAAVFQMNHGHYRLLSRLYLVRPPLIVSHTKSNGYRDLIVRVSGGGVPQPYYALLKFDGMMYPANPSLAVPLPGNSIFWGTALFSEDGLAGAALPLHSE